MISTFRIENTKNLDKGVEKRNKVWCLICCKEKSRLKKKKKNMTYDFIEELKKI